MSAPLAKINYRIHTDAIKDTLIPPSITKELGRLAHTLPHTETPTSSHCPHSNGKKCGGREKGAPPEQGALRQYPSIDLKHGDHITVGKSTIEVRVETGPDDDLVPPALQEGDLSQLSPDALRQLLVAGASRARPFSGHLAPSLLDDYTITRELGRGGCGAVYLATPKAGGDPVAVKLMLSRAQAEPRAIEQFKREMQVIAGLQHPNIVRFLDVTGQPS